MSYYNTCSYCGCHLDPGEKCDCQGTVEYHRNIQEYQNKAIRYSGYSSEELKPIVNKAV